MVGGEGLVRGKMVMRFLVLAENGAGGKGLGFRA